MQKIIRTLSYGMEISDCKTNRGVLKLVYRFGGVVILEMPKLHNSVINKLNLPVNGNKKIRARTRLIF